MQVVSAAFTAAEIADIAQVAAKVFIYRGNYASTAFGSTATASDTDVSGNYPAAGAIDGDRTEINIGAASVADNGVGLSSWQGSATPSGGSPSWLQVAFGSTRTFNYVKVYNLASNPLTAYTLQWSTNGSVWNTFATYSAAARTGGGLDIFDFSGAGTTFSAAFFRVLITGSTSGAANIVEVEIYYKQDITSRCTSVKTDRQRDWKQINPMSATCSLSFDNSDQFFSSLYTPTAAQVTAGFFNSEIDATMKIQVQMGYWYSSIPYFDLGWGEGGFGEIPWGGGGGALSLSGPELINVFIGTVDTWDADSRPGTCMISGRDGMKDTLNQTWSTRLKYNIDMGLAVQYMLNICNVSNYEMNVALTGLLVPYFFVFEDTAYDIIQQLVQAAGSASYWVDENGIHQFANLLAQSSNSQTDFTWIGANLSNFYVSYISGASFTNNGNSINLNGGSSGATGVTAALPSTQANGWQFTFFNNIAPTLSAALIMFAAVGDGTSLNTVGYGLELGASVGGITLNKFTGSISSPTVLATYAGSTTNPMNFTIIRDPSGNFYVWMNSVLIIGPINDTTYTSFDHFTATASGNQAVFTLSNINFLNTNYVPTFSGGVLTVTSEVISQGAAIAEGVMSVGFSPTNAPITYQTRTANNIGMSGASAWTTVTINATTQQGPIPSPVNSFIQYRFFFTVGSTPPLWAPYYVTVNWSLSSTSGTVRQLFFNSSLCNVKQTISDSLGGDSSIINYWEVISSPNTLTGTTADVQWTATNGQPIIPISASNPLILNTGIITIQAVIQGGMDITYMGASLTLAAGASGGVAGTNALLVTMGTAAGTISISYIHPTKPIITLNITTAGTITNLQLIGQAFSSVSNPIDIIAPPPALGKTPSQIKYGRRTNSINNNFIPNAAVAQLIANTQLSLFQFPAQILTGIETTLTPSVQLTDQLQLTDKNLALSSSQSWNNSGTSHEITKAAGEGQGATIKTTMTAVALGH